MEKIRKAPENYERDARLRTCVVAGTASGAGKTSVAEVVTGLIARRAPTAAAKITVTHGERGCPHGGKGCNVCSSLGGDYQIITRESIIGQSGTDTARLREAGASTVLWTITRDVSILDAWRSMLPLMSGARWAVIESNSLALKIRPTLTLMVADPTVSRRLWKPSATSLLASADYVIFNDRGTANKRAALLEEIKSVRGTEAGIIYTTHPSRLAEEPSELVEMLDGLKSIS